jgi:hypothetical protein
MACAAETHGPRGRWPLPSMASGQAGSNSRSTGRSAAAGNDRSEIAAAVDSLGPLMTKIAIKQLSLIRLHRDNQAYEWLGNGRSVPIGVRRAVRGLADALRREMQPR